MIKSHATAVLLALSGSTILAPAVRAADEYAPQIPDVAIYRAMLDANKQPGWVQFRDFMGKQLVYFTPLQSMHCRLSGIRYSINSDALDKMFPVAKCDPQLPFNMPDDPNNEYIYLSLKAGEAKSIAVQAVWDDGAGSEIIIYKPCQNVGESTCAAIETVKKPEMMETAPAPEGAVR
jgi:hypothetical protein